MRLESLPADARTQKRRHNSDFEAQVLSAGEAQVHFRFESGGSYPIEAEILAVLSEEHASAPSQSSTCRDEDTLGFLEVDVHFQSRDS